MPEILDSGQGGTGDSAGGATPATSPAQEMVQLQNQLAEMTKKYNGMNGAYQKLMNEHGALKGQTEGLNTALTNAHQQLGVHQASLKDWEAKYTGLDADNTKLADELSKQTEAAATAQRLYDRLALVSQKYSPALAFWNVLKDVPGTLEDFTKSVEEFTGTLTGMQTNGAKSLLAGATGPASAGPKEGAMDKESAYAALNKLIDQGTTSGPEYEQALNQWMTLSAK